MLIKKHLLPQDNKLNKKDIIIITHRRFKIKSINSQITCKTIDNQFSIITPGGSMHLRLSIIPRPTI